MSDKDEAQRIYAEHLVRLWGLYYEMGQIENHLYNLQKKYHFGTYELACMRYDASKRRTSPADASTIFHG